MKKLLLHSAILAALSMSANADGFKSGVVPVQVKQDTTQQNVEPLKVEAKDIQKEDHSANSPLTKILEQHQEFIWDQEKINSAQTETNKKQEEVNQKLATTINKTIDAVNNKTSSTDDYARLKNRIIDLEYANDRLKSTINSLESRLNSLERRVR